MGEEDTWGRKNATMKHLVGLFRRDETGLGQQRRELGNHRRACHTGQEHTHGSDKESRVRHESLFRLFSKLPWSLALQPTRHHVGPLYRCYRGADLR